MLDTWHRSVGLLAALGLFIVELAGAAGTPLPARHREFLNGPTSLLLTKAERETFQKLPTDEERDKFIERFWDLTLGSIAEEMFPSAGGVFYKHASKELTCRIGRGMLRQD